MSFTPLDCALPCRYIKFDTFHPAVDMGLPVTRVISRITLQVGGRGWLAMCLLVVVAWSSCPAHFALLPPLLQVLIRSSCSKPEAPSHCVAPWTVAWEPGGCMPRAGG